MYIICAISVHKVVIIIVSFNPSHGVKLSRLLSKQFLGNHKCAANQYVTGYGRARRDVGD